MCPSLPFLPPITPSRSGKEGIYPDLVKFTEERLSQLDPNSHLLVEEGKKKRLADLPGVEQRDLEKDIEVCLSVCVCLSVKCPAARSLYLAVYTTVLMYVVMTQCHYFSICIS